MTSDKLNNNTPWQDLTIGGNIYTAGNAKEFKTGDWRSTTPIFKSELCKHCGGETIKLPTLQTLSNSIDALQLFYDIYISHKKTEEDIPMGAYSLVMQIKRIYNAQMHEKFD